MSRQRWNIPWKPSLENGNVSPKTDDLPHFTGTFFANHVYFTPTSLKALLEVVFLQRFHYVKVNWPWTQEVFIWHQYVMCQAIDSRVETVMKVSGEQLSWNCQEKFRDKSVRGCLLSVGRCWCQHHYWHSVWYHGGHISRQPADEVRCCQQSHPCYVWGALSGL